MSGRERVVLDADQIGVGASKSSAKRRAHRSPLIDERGRGCGRLLCDGRERVITLIEQRDAAFADFLYDSRFGEDVLQRDAVQPEDALLVPHTVARRPHPVLMSSVRPNRRPIAGEYPAALEPYIARVAVDDVVGFLGQQLDDVLALFGALPPGHAGFRYAPDKWSVQEVIGHVTDAEWIFTSRALRWARGDETPLSGFDSGTYVDVARSVERTLDSVVEEFRHLRSANLLLFDSFDGAVLDLRGTASGARLTVRAALFFLGGHAQHHLDVLRERYL